MEIFESDYWKLTIFLQKFVGLWFFQSMWKNIVSWTYVFSFTLSFMIAMGIRLYNEIGVNIGIVVENITGELYLMVVLCSLIVSVFNKNELKFIYNQIATDWKQITDADELKIMHEYAEIGRKNGKLYAAYMIIGVSSFLALPIISPLWDYVIPLENITRPKALPYYAEYGIDEETYYYPLIGQAIFGGVGTITIVVTFDLVFILTVQHIVALFNLVNLNLKKVWEVSKAIEDNQVSFLKGDYTAVDQLIRAINLHQRVINYVNLIEKCYNIAWLLVLCNNMLMLGGGLTTILLKSDRPEETIRYGVVVVAGLIHFYFVFLPGQKIIDSSLEVFDNCYGCKWYNLSEKSKNLIKIMMQRSCRHCELTGGKMFVLCMDTYSNMMKTGFSIFTLLR